MRRFKAILLLVALTVKPCLGDIAISNTTISGTLEVPAGEFGNLGGTVTLDNGLIDVYGTLSSGLGTVVLTGNGEVYLNSPTGRWSYGCCGTNSVTIDPGVTVLGERGTSYASKGTVNRGTFAAVAGGSTSSGFTILANHGFVNEGVLEARSGGVLRIDGATPVTFGTGSVLRANADGVIRVQGAAITSLADLGTVENLGGTIQLYGANLNNAGQTTSFSGGEWSLLSGTEIVGGVLETSSGGTLSIVPQGTSPRDNPVQFDGVTLLGDLQLLSGGVLKAVNTMTLDGANVRFEGGTTYLYLDAATAIGGTGTLVSEGTGTARIEASGGLVTLPAGVDLRASSGTLSLLRRSGDATSTYDISGDVVASAGTISNTTEVTTRAMATAINGGKLTLGNTWNNLGTMQVVNGGVLELTATLNNQGSLTVNNANIIYRGGMISGPGSQSITNSRVLASGSSTLGPYLAIGGTGLDRGVYNGSLDLEGGTITVGSQPGEFWTLIDGTLFNGTVNSVGGGELTIGVPTGLLGKPRGTVRNLELNADIRITTDASLTVDGPLTGTGQLIVDGGLLTIGNRPDDIFSHAVIERVSPLAGTVVLTGPIDNVGQTIHLPAGVEWRISHSRTDVFRGGRIEGDPGVELRVTYGYSFETTEWATFRQGVTLALPMVIDNTRMSVREGLTLDDTSISIGSGNGDQFDDSRIAFQGEQVLSGLGEIRFNNINGFPSNPLYPRINMIEITDQQSLPAGLTIGPDIVIRTAGGSGYVGGSYFYQLPPERVPLANHGVLLAENGHTLTLFASSFDQQGTLRAEADSTLRIEIDAFQNDGHLETTGGVFQFTGDFTQSSTASFTVTLAEILSGAAIDVAGVALLEGLLKVELAESYVPTAGETIPLINSSGGLSGMFLQSILPSLPTGLFWQMEKTPNSLSLSVFDGGPLGDFDSDGDVDAADFLKWQRDPSVGLLADWKTNYGVSASTATSAAVPEPSNLLLGVMVSIVSLAARRLK
ncbi:autotransporter outer membrane beta-barrel domain-containing protein [Bythopirellula goksoeyrii]|uniref:Lipoprotein n=1 Tax=Bythopirellula goksoeyrii TaxID=1400387 RepID=A0A5B9QIT7_9BACT|nr:hypothetical protein [Bythopirellula goksoeyrii]QEG37919.1 hypothetical protein Pr1d_52670 [Bythopirellula goksoeyrii]